MCVCVCTTHEHLHTARTSTANVSAGERNGAAGRLRPSKPKAGDKFEEDLGFNEQHKTMHFAFVFVLVVVPSEKREKAAALLCSPTCVNKDVHCNCLHVTCRAAGKDLLEMF